MTSYLKIYLVLIILKLLSNIYAQLDSIYAIGFKTGDMVDHGKTFYSKTNFLVFTYYHDLPIFIQHEPVYYLFFIR